MNPRPVQRLLSRALKFSSNVVTNLKKDPGVVGYAAGGFALIEGAVSFVSYMGGESQPNVLTCYATAASTAMVARTVYLLGRRDGDDDGRRDKTPAPQPLPPDDEKPNFYKFLKLDDIGPRASCKSPKLSELV